MARESTDRAIRHASNNSQPPPPASGDSGYQSNREEGPNPEDRFEVDNVPLRDAAMITSGSQSHIIQRGQSNSWEPLPALHTPHQKRLTILIIGLVLATLDLCILPITYFYALKFDTNLKLQEIFAVITGVYGLISFTHYAFRSLKLFRSKTQPIWRPVGWSRWGLAEFLQVNILIVITLVEIELVVGTIPTKPFVRLCAMPSPTICYYLGSLFIISAILTQIHHPLPFNMSSTPKGTPWRPALVAFIEDAGAIEARGGTEYRKAVMKRYEMSSRFRRLMLILSWFWGIGLISIAIVSTALIMVLPEDIGFGVGWGLPWAWAACCCGLTVVFVKRELKIERSDWRIKEGLSHRRSVV